MIWEEVEKRFGKKLANKMKKSHYLRGITVEFTKDGKIDYPERDIDLAFRDVTGKKIFESIGFDNIAVARVILRKAKRENYPQDIIEELEKKIKGYEEQVELDTDRAVFK